MVRVEGFLLNCAREQAGSGAGLGRKESFLRGGVWPARVGGNIRRVEMKDAGAGPF